MDQFWTSKQQQQQQQRNAIQFHNNSCTMMFSNKHKAKTMQEQWNECDPFRAACYPHDTNEKQFHLCILFTPPPPKKTSNPSPRCDLPSYLLYRIYRMDLSGIEQKCLSIHRLTEDSGHDPDLR